MSFCKLECSSASLVMMGGDSLLVFRIWGHVLSPPTGGSASVIIMSGILCPSTILRSCVCFVIVCDFRVRFYFSNMCFVSRVVSCVYDVFR